jgi:hypothetical protein
VRDVANFWNTKFPPTSDEVMRTVQIAAYQNNKLNPFILDSSLLKRAFFVATNDAAACAAVFVANEDVDFSTLPDGFQLGDAYPNPFNPTAQFTLAVAQNQHVRLEVFDMTGRLVATLFNGQLAANHVHAFTFQANHATSGVYFCHAIGEHFAATKKMVLVK